MRYLLTLAILLLSVPTIAGEVYKKPKDFISNSFDGEIPKAKTLLMSEDDIYNIKKITKQKYNFKKVKYWQRNSKTAFILEDIGKTKPITTGYLVEDSKINNVQVLIYRESHGWEVKYPFFTKQFKETSLNEDNKLSKSIEAISGATLSVNALRRMAKVALYLESRINAKL